MDTVIIGAVASCLGQVWRYCWVLRKVASLGIGFSCSCDRNLTLRAFPKLRTDNNHRNHNPSIFIT